MAQAYVLAQNARLQLQALTLGEVYYLNTAEIDSARAPLLQLFRASVCGDGSSAASPD